MRIVTYVDTMSKPLANELTDETEYPFEILAGDINGGDLYGEAWIKNLIPANRVVDALESHIFEYNHLYARGRFVIDKNSGTRVIVNQHGQIIEKNRGAQITSLPIAPLPPSPTEQISRMRAYVEDLSGVHDVSLGRLPATIRSGVAIAELRQSDATNQADIVDNLEDFLSRSGKKILRLVAENWTTTRLITVTGIKGQPEHFMAIGERGITKKKKFKFGEKELSLAVIGADNEVRVQVGSWLAYTKEARMEKLKEYYRLGVIDQQTFLQHAEFADIDGIMKRTREEQMYQQYAGSKSQEIEKQYGIQLDDQSLAMAENELMLEGVEQMAEAGDDHDLHLMVHKEEAGNELVKKHMAEHERFRKWQTKMKARPLTDVPPTEDGLAVPPEMMGGVTPPPPPGVGGTVEPFVMNPVVGPGAPPLPGGGMI